MMHSFLQVFETQIKSKCVLRSAHKVLFSCRPGKRQLTSHISHWLSNVGCGRNGRPKPLIWQTSKRSAQRARDKSRSCSMVSVGEWTRSITHTQHQTAKCGRMHSRGTWVSQHANIHTQKCTYWLMLKDTNGERVTWIHALMRGRESTKYGIYSGHQFPFTYHFILFDFRSVQIPSVNWLCFDKLQEAAYTTLARLEDVLTPCY